MIRVSVIYILLNVYCYSLSGQVCLTDANNPVNIGSVPYQFFSGSNGHTIRVAIHIIADNQCQFGVTSAQVYSALQTLENDLRPHNICISLVRIITICDDQLAFNGGYLYNSYPSTDAIDFYFLPVTNSFAGGATTSIPDTKLIISGTNPPLFGGQPLISTHALSHEFGHCLGLYHTFNGASQCATAVGACPELVNGGCSVSCTTSECGDYVSDTPADPCMNQNDVNSNTCQYSNTIYDENNDLYIPDTRNIMSYSHPSCQDHFSNGQGNRMRYFLENNASLIARLVPENVFVQNLYLNNATGQTNYISEKSITAGSNVTSGAAGNVEFINTTKSLFKAAGYIDLEPGFSSFPIDIAGPNDGFFSAEIDPDICGYSTGINSAKTSSSRSSTLLPSAWLSTSFTIEGNISILSITQSDSLINGILYTKIKREIVDLPGVFSNPFFSGFYLSFLRKDSITNKIYSFENNHEIMMYDFSLNLGDTFSFATTTVFTLTTIDSIFGSIGYLKRFIFSDTSNQQIVWINGIGNIADPFDNKDFYNTGDILLCFHEQGILKYEDLSMVPVQCSNFTVVENKIQQNVIKIFPNPFVSSFNYYSENSRIEKIELFDLAGHKIFSDVKPMFEGKYFMDNLSQGLYFIKFYFKNDSTENFRIIKN